MSQWRLIVPGHSFSLATVMTEPVVPELGDGGDMDAILDWYILPEVLKTHVGPHLSRRTLMALRITCRYWRREALNIMRVLVVMGRNFLDRVRPPPGVLVVIPLMRNLRQLSLHQLDTPITSALTKDLRVLRWLRVAGCANVSASALLAPSALKVLRLNHLRVSEADAAWEGNPRAF
jgi:hypothetical protein